MFKIILLIGLLFGLYVVVNLIYASFTDYQPPLSESIPVNIEQTLLPDSSEFTFMIWNIGYAGLGAKDDFFYDGGKTVISSKENVEAYLSGIKKYLEQNSNTDFILLQEVDYCAKRSYRTNQLEAIASVLPQHSNSYARNYLVKFVPVPYLSPMGGVDAGLGSFSRYALTETTRYQLPGEFPWPKRIYFLDRCILVQRTPLPNGKDLVVINIHNSAYDETGELKRQEMAFIKDYLLKEYDKGNYIVVGGDWNQSPPGFDKNTYTKRGDDYAPENIDAGKMPQGWQWVHDSSVPTNRNLKGPFNPETTSCTVIDFFLVSPNIEVLKVKTQDLQFEWSDHQPVSMKVKLGD